jgi:hypothetical protein
MESKQSKIRELGERIESLLEESYALQRTRASWPRHVEIQAEIMRLCRLVSDLHSRDEPYWMKLDGSAGQSLKAKSNDSKSDDTRAA